MEAEKDLPCVVCQLSPPINILLWKKWENMQINRVNKAAFRDLRAPLLLSQHRQSCCWAFQRDPGAADGLSERNISFSMNPLCVEVCESNSAPRSSHGKPRLFSQSLKNKVVGFCFCVLFFSPLPGVVRGVRGGQAALAPFRVHSESSRCVWACRCGWVCVTGPSRAGGQAESEWEELGGFGPGWQRGERDRCRLGQTPPPSLSPRCGPSLIPPPLPSRHAAPASS